MLDDPYNQNEVKSGWMALDKLVASLGEKMYHSFGIERSSLFDDSGDEYVIVHHTCDLSPENKKAIAEIVNQILTVKKSSQKEAPEKLIVFEKKSAGDCYEF